MMKTLLSALFCLILPITAIFAQRDSLDKKNKLHPDFEAYLNDAITPDLPIITCEQLRILQQTNRDMNILDTRTVEEYQVSHIRNARWVGSEDFTIERIWALDRSKPVVIYGAIGEQSEWVGKKLQEMGFKDVRNLYASIFEWMYEGGEVVDKEGKNTHKVQIFSNKKLRFLHSPYWHK